MIKQSFIIDKYDWQVVVLYEVYNSDTSDVISILKLFGADTNVMRVACYNIINNRFNNGFTYSDYQVLNINYFTKYFRHSFTNTTYKITYFFTFFVKI